MIVHTVRNLLAAERVDEVVVATDDERIADTARDAGAVVVITRERHETGTDRVGEAVRRLGLGQRTILNLQADEPLLRADAIDACVAASMGAPRWDIATLAAPCEGDEARQAAVVKIAMAGDGRALYFSRGPIPWQQQEPMRFLRHIGIYAFRSGALERFLSLPRGRLERLERLEQLRALEGGLSVGVVVGDYSTVAIDTAEDLARARAIVSGAHRRRAHDSESRRT